MINLLFRRFPRLIAAAMTVLCLLPSTTAAQLSGSNLKGRHRPRGRLAAAARRLRRGAVVLGPEVTLALATKQAVYGFVIVRDQWEFAARTATEGAVWKLMVDFPLTPIRLPQP